MSGSFEDSPEYDDWLDSGARTEDYSDYYNKWLYRTEKEWYEKRNQ